jgi:hypothetical protein
MMIPWLAAAQNPLQRNCYRRRRVNGFLAKVLFVQRVLRIAKRNDSGLNARAIGGL